VFWFNVGTSAAWIAANAAFVPLERRYCPDVWVPVKAVMAVAALVAPVPPLVTGSVPVTAVVKLTLVIALLEPLMFLFETVFVLVSVRTLVGVMIFERIAMIFLTR
jgi:hypothetical protein